MVELARIFLKGTPFAIGEIWADLDKVMSDHLSSSKWSQFSLARQFARYFLFSTKHRFVRDAESTSSDDAPIVSNVHNHNWPSCFSGVRTLPSIAHSRSRRWVEYSNSSIAQSLNPTSLIGFLSTHIVGLPTLWKTEFLGQNKMYSQSMTVLMMSQGWRTQAELLAAIENRTIWPTTEPQNHSHTHQHCHTKKIENYKFGDFERIKSL